MKFLRKSGEGDHLFGSVTAGDIAEALEKKSFHIDRRKIQLHEPLKTVGEFIVPIKLHKDVTHASESHRRQGSGGRIVSGVGCGDWVPACTAGRSPDHTDSLCRYCSGLRIQAEKVLYFFQVGCPAVGRQALDKHPSVLFFQNPIVKKN